MAFKKNPPLRSVPARNIEEELDRFAQAAGSAPESSTHAVAKTNSPLPWEEAQVREDVVKNIPLRLSEPLYLKLKFIAKHTPYSMNSFIIERLTEIVDEEIAQMVPTIRE